MESGYKNGTIKIKPFSFLAWVLLLSDGEATENHEPKIIGGMSPLKKTAKKSLKTK